MLKADALLILLTISSLFAYGQNPINVTGVLRDKNGDGLGRATLVLVGSKDTMKTVSKEDGTYFFHVDQGGDYLLQISMKGYKIFQGAFSIYPTRHSFVIPPIILMLDYEELVPVMVMGIKPITIKEDTVEYHTGAFKLRPGDELERLMKQLPGVDWDTGGNVIFEGKKVNRIMINGQDFTAGNVKMALQNLPADIIDKVQLIDEYDDKAKLTGVKSGEAEKIINIVLKEDKRNGGIANLVAGDGTKDRYTESLYSNIFKGEKQITINGSLNNNSTTGDFYQRGIFLGLADNWSKKWSGNGGIGLSDDNYSSSSGTIEDDYFSGSTNRENQFMQNAGNDQNSTLGYTAKYYPTPDIKIRLNSFLGIYQNQRSASSNFTGTEQDSAFVKTSTGNSLNISRSHSLSSISAFYFEKVNPHSKSRLSIAASYQYTGLKENDDDQNHTNIQTDNFNSISQQHLLAHTSNYSSGLSSKLDYYASIGTTSLLELGYAVNSTTTQASRLMQTPDSIHNTLMEVDSLDNKYTFILSTQTIHVGYLNHRNKVNLSMSLDAQPGIQSSHDGSKISNQPYKYFNFLPLFQLSYELNSSRKFNIAYLTSVTPPNIQQLNPVIDLTNPQYPVQGNAGLKPSYTQSINLYYQQSSLRPTQYSGFQMGLVYQTTENVIITNLLHPHDTSSVIQKATYDNANGFKSLMANYQIHFPTIFQNRFHITTNGTLRATHGAVMTDNTLYGTNSLDWSQGLQITLEIPNIIESSLSGSYAYSFTRYASLAAVTTPFSSFNWSFNSQNYLLKKWIIVSYLSQVFTSGISRDLKNNPVLLNVSIQRDLFSRNQARITFSAADIFNNNTGISQSITTTGITQTRSDLIGRYFLLSIIFKLEKFHRN